MSNFYLLPSTDVIDKFELVYFARFFVNCRVGPFTLNASKKNLFVVVDYNISRPHIVSLPPDGAMSF